MKPEAICGYLGVITYTEIGGGMLGDIGGSTHRTNVQVPMQGCRHLFLFRYRHTEIIRYVHRIVLGLIYEMIGTL